MPQLQALVECRLAIGVDVPIIADGGITRDGALAQALVCGGDTAMRQRAQLDLSPGLEGQASAARQRAGGGGA